MVKILIKNRLRGLVGAMLTGGRKGSTKQRSTGRVVLFSLLYLYVAVVFIGLATFMAISLGSLMIPLGAPRLYFAVFMIADLSITFVLSIFETKSELFECRDNELLFSMPIRPRDIVISRILVVLIYNYVTEAVVMIPAIVVYAVIAKDIVGVFGALVVSLFIPLLATALASAVGYVIAEISRRVRNNNIVVILLSVAFLALYFYGCFAMGFYSEDFANSMQSFDFAAIEKSMPVLYFIGSAALFAPLATVAVTVGSLLVAAIAYTVISLNYLKIITDNRGKKKVEYTEKTLERSGVLFALVKKELSRFFTSAAYMLNAGLGLVFEVVIGVLLVIKRADLIEVATIIFGDVDMLTPLMTCALIFFASMTMMSASALSLEGSSLWIAKTMPVTDKQLLWSKALPQIIVSAPPTLITSVLLIVALAPNPLTWPFIILIPQASSVTFALLGINMNVLSHRFDYETEVHAIKQSLSVFLTMLLQMVTAIIASVGAILLTFVSLWLALAILLLVFSLFALGLALLTSGPSAKRYSRIEV